MAFETHTHAGTQHAGAAAAGGDSADAVVADLVAWAAEFAPGPNQKLRDIFARATAVLAKEQEKGRAGRY